MSRVLNLIDFTRSLHYNPFAYLQEEEDVSVLVDNIMANTKGGDRISGDQFWEDGPRMLLASIFDYVWFECSKSEQNWTSVFKYLDMVTVSDEKNEYERIPGLPGNFQRVRKQSPGSQELQDL